MLGIGLPKSALGSNTNLDRLAFDFAPALDKSFSVDGSGNIALTTRRGPNIAFSRASGGTFVDADGLIKYAPENRLPSTDDFAGWVNSTVSVIDGEAHMTVSSSANYAVYNDNSPGWIVASTLLPAAARTSDWTRVEIKVTIPAGCTSARFYPMRNGGSDPMLYVSAPVVAGDVTLSAEWKMVGSELWVRKPMVYSGAPDGRAYLENPSSSPVYGPRFEHDPTTGECLGLLVEEQRTNLVSWSNMENVSFRARLGAYVKTIDPKYGEFWRMTSTADDGLNYI